MNQLASCTVDMESCAMCPCHQFRDARSPQGRYCRLIGSPDERDGGLHRSLEGRRRFWACRWDDSHLRKLALQRNRRSLLLLESVCDYQPAFSSQEATLRLPHCFVSSNFLPHPLRCHIAKSQDILEVPAHNVQIFEDSQVPS
jgi:hypothetical protein